MREIREYIFNRLAYDIILQGYTGFSASDERVYLEFPPEKVALTVDKPAYITYNLMEPGPIDPTLYIEAAQVPDVVVEINVWAFTPDARDNCAERIALRFKDHWFTTDNYRILTTDLETGEDITELQEGTGQIDHWRHYMRFRMRPVYKLAEPYYA